MNKENKVIEWLLKGDASMIPYSLLSKKEQQKVSGNFRTDIPGKLFLKWKKQVNQVDGIL